MEKILMIMVVAEMFLFAGCSSVQPVIREVEIQNKKLDGDTFTSLFKELRFEFIYV